VLEVAANFVPGGMVRRGEMLLQIDPADFENALSIRQSELEQVEADWEIEVGRQALAEQELELLGDSINGINRSLVLREPQAASLKSQMSAAQAAVQRAELDLERTKLIAPFDALVLRREANVGSQVQPGDDLGQLVGIDEYWVMAAVPVRNLRWLTVPDVGQEGSKAKLYDSGAWGPESYREGRVKRMIGSLDQQTRLARILVAVEDPLGQAGDLPPLILDTLVDVRIEGTPLQDVVRLQREYVHDGDTVWVMVDGELQIRHAEIVFQDPKFAYISNGLHSGEEVVTTTLATVAEGVKLRKITTADAIENPGAGEQAR
jgi:multidrug efflux pump subunit AcrA (membrane-fusion protein)